MNELCQLTATEAVALLTRREVSPLELLDAALERIAQTDPRLNAVPTLCVERARAHARRLTDARDDDLPPWRLRGLPIVVKDNVEVEGVRCTFGSPLFADHVSTASDPVVERLEANGAVVVGKSNIPEFAAGGITFNEVFGVTRSPWNLAMTPGGSSGGTAAALAAGQVWLGTGNDFGGSIRLPASFCSLVGLRPTAGLVPRIQRQPYSPLNVEGPLARTVADCALMLENEAGYHPRDPLSSPIVPGSFVSAASRPMRPRRLAFSVDLGVAPIVHEEVARVCTDAAARLEAAGCPVSDEHPDLRDALSTFMTLRGAAFVANMGPLIERCRDRMKRDVVQNYEFGAALSVGEVVRAEVAQGEIVRRMAAFFERHDALLCPVALAPPIEADRRCLERLGDVEFDGYLGWLMMTCVISATGCPVLALPCGFTTTGLPIGMQLIGPPRSDARLLAIGAWIEQCLAVPRAPIEPRSATD